MANETIKQITSGDVTRDIEDAAARQAAAAAYQKPADGIPKTDLAQSVQTSLGLADTALQEADKNQLQAAINAVQTALNALIGGNVQGAIDTFNEVTAFLDGIDTSDPTLKNQLLALNTAITNLGNSLATVATSGSYNDLSNKPTIPSAVSDLANDAGYTTNTGTVTGISVNGGTAQQPTNGVVNLTVATGGDNDLVGLSEGTANDGAVVFTKRNGDTITLNLNHVHPQYLKYELLADEAAYTALATKDSSTLYLIPEA